ncbi:hypothetical protein KP509_16G066700 [Ceratopteris richardii]|nr:hypothetical protein KP509_16G066700 [Ceratopteris richardii]
MDEYRVEILREQPSAQEFASEVEARNIPVVYQALIKNWPASLKWSPEPGSFDYLKIIAGGERVQAMLTASGNTFYGDIRSHERVELKFGDYLDYASQIYAEALTEVKEQGCSDVESQSKGQRTHLYLAQVPMFSKDEGTSPLRALMADIIMPSFLNPTSVANINFWMTARESKSSTHYDPYHNILCVVVGQKKVRLWPPNMTPYLYPYPIYGEASNHSSVDFMRPYEMKHPLFKHALDSCQVVTLCAGDALFIPEGWYHQVDSHSFTMAVNIWWPSVVALNLDSHMSGYYLRRIVSSLLDSEKRRLVKKGMSGQSVDEVNFIAGSTELPSSITASASESKNKEMADSGQLKESGRKHAFEALSSIQKQCLYHLVQVCKPDMEAEQNPDSEVKTSKDIGRESVSNAERIVECFKPHPHLMPLQREDSVACAFRILDPLDLKQVLLVMVDYFPRTLELLICKQLSPIAAEVLTKKFEEMDLHLSDAEQSDFYKAFYGVFEDPKVAMSALLDGKEKLSALVLNYVLEAYLGLTLNL